MMFMYERDYHQMDSVPRGTTCGLFPFNLLGNIVIGVRTRKITTYWNHTNIKLQGESLLIERQKLHVFFFFQRLNTVYHDITLGLILSIESKSQR